MRLTCGNDRSRRGIPESSIRSEKGAFHVGLWSKHSKKKVLVPMLYMTFLDRTSLIRLILNSSQKRFPRRIKNECCVQLTPIKKTPYKEDPPIKKSCPKKSYTTLGPKFFFWSVLAITRRGMHLFQI